MKAHEKKKFYRQWCARQLRAGLTASTVDGSWGKHANVPESTKHNLQHGAHPYTKRSGA